MSPVFWTILNSILLFCLTTAVTFYLRAAKKRADDLKDLKVQGTRAADLVLGRLSQLEQQMVVMSTQVTPLWRAVESKIIRDLTHPSPQFHEMDRLLHRLEMMTITKEERDRLAVLLKERIASIDPEVSEEEKRSARLLAGVMEKVLSEDT